MVAAVILTGTAHPLRAQTAPPAGKTSQDERDHQRQKFPFSINQKMSEYTHNLEWLDRTKLLVKTAPFAILLPQFHPSSPGIVAFRNVPLVAVQYKRLMRAWSRYQLQVFLESLQKPTVILNLPIEVQSCIAPGPRVT
jgi:hypothetical protein